MTMINLKTVTTAPEPDRSKKFTSEYLDRVMSAGVDRHIRYEEGRGWTWGTGAAAMDWERYVGLHSNHFPLTEVERKVALVNTHTTYSVTDCGGDQLTLGGGRSTIVLATQREDNPGTRRSIVLNRHDAADLLEALQSMVKIEG